MKKERMKNKLLISMIAMTYMHSGFSQKATQLLSCYHYNDDGSGDSVWRMRSDIYLLPREVILSGNVIFRKGLIMDSTPTPTSVINRFSSFLSFYKKMKTIKYFDQYQYHIYFV